MNWSVERANDTEPSWLIWSDPADHSVQNLHAKVFVIGARALVGSTSVSYSSANVLIEALVETDVREAVALCRDFVRSLEGEAISKAYARRMQRLYRPPHSEMGARRSVGCFH